MNSQPRRDPETSKHPAADESPAHDDLAAQLYLRLSGTTQPSVDLEAAIEELRPSHDGAVYSEAIHLLTHLRFPPDAAERHWRHVLGHRRAMERRLERSVDTRVAMLSYFMDVDRMLHNPKVVEMNVFEETRDRGFRDALTGLRNYRYFAEYLAQEVARCDQYNTTVSLLLIDLDRFKLFNDGHGHEAGNRVLAEVARLMTACVRRSDTLARYGGEEFAVILPQTPKDAALDVAERLRRTIEGHRFDLGDGAPRESLTISLGLAACPADARVAEGLIRSADAALYGAKAEGRNRLQAFGHSRRSYPRVATAVKGRFLVADGTFRPLTTVSLSTGGMLFFTDCEVRPGALIDARLEIPGSAQEISFSGRVVAVNPCESGVEASVRAIDLPAGDRKSLSDYLRSVGVAAVS